MKDKSFGVWIGYYKDSPEEEHFKWLDNSGRFYENWVPTEPNGYDVSSLSHKAL